jgi:ribonuclease BN (tRNA processing enzyme)
MLELIILGSGTSVPSPSRGAPAHLVLAEGYSLLVDCGSGCTGSLARAGVTLDRLGGILLSHFHPDHTADLVPLLFALANPSGPARTDDLFVWGPPGLAEHMEGLAALYGRWVRPRQAGLRVQELRPGDALQAGPLRVRAFATRHTESSLAFRIEQAGSVLCYSGDSGPCPGLEQAARDADLLLCECSALDEAPVEGHMTPAAVGRLASAAGCCQVVLTHLYDGLAEQDLPALVARHYPGPVQLAADGLRLAVRAKRSTGGR